MKALRFVDVGDTHGDEIEETLAEKFFAWLADWKPDVVIHGGDLFNLAALRKKATEDERTKAIAPDIEAGKEFAKRLFSFGARRYFTRGNHDERIYHVARDAKDAALSHCATTLCTELETLMRRLKVAVLPYDSRDGVLDIDGFRVIHGYLAGIGAARRFAQIYGTCVFHHTHTLDVCPVEKWPETAVAYGAGCMLKKDQAYCASQVNKLRHENGWLYGFIHNGHATVFQAKFKDGSVHVAQSFKSY